MRDKLKALRLNHFFSAGILMVFGNNIVNVFNYLYHFAMGRLLGPASYGELATLISLVGLLLIIPTSFGLAITRLVATGSGDTKSKKLLNWVIKKTFVVSLLISLVFCLFSPIISAYLKISNIWFVILIGVFFTFSMMSYFYRSILQGLFKFTQLILTTLGESIAKLVLGIVFVYSGFSVFGALGGILLAAIFALFLSKKFIGNFLNSKDDNSVKTAHLKELVIYSVPVAIFTIAQTSLFSADLILVKHFFSSYDAGLYAVLSSLGKIIIFGASPIIMVMFPMISKRHAGNQNYMRIFLLSLGFTLAVCTSVLLLFYLFPEFIIQISVGSSYLPAASILFLFGIFISLISISNLLINFMLSLKRTKVVIFPSIAALAQILLINFFHNSLLQVITISIALSFCLIISLSLFSFAKK